MTRQEFNLLYKINKEKIKINKRKTKSVSQIEQDIELHKRAQDFIEQIEDNFIKQIIEYRYSQCMTWKQVAYAIGGKNTQDGVRKIATRYFEKINR